MSSMVGTCFVTPGPVVGRVGEKARSRTGVLCSQLTFYRRILARAACTPGSDKNAETLIGNTLEWNGGVGEPCSKPTCAPPPNTPTGTMVEPVPEFIHFPTEEERILQIWKEKDCFQECLKQSKNRPR
ncbi:hypothetical protein JZ751_029807 [Albula glossodonta]|uniref:Uncharacterized protein n=1 Tax=Albula glossodonta TaxID=121402 RepID=A0A8T2NCM4_9TELE|nr:hypothetical protein JZ751_029807 [Albula glossodonta]